jgi:hypothetical protein
MTAILNQVLLDFEDTATFARESLAVLNAKGRTVPMLLNPAQIKLDETIRKIRARKRPVRIVILKSRRAGFSTGVAATLFKETPFRTGQKTLIVAQEDKAVKESLFPMYDRFNTHYKPFRNIIALPKLVSDRQDGLEWENESSISIQTAKNLQGARSFGYRRVHLSEYAFYPNAKTLMTGLMQTVPNDPDTIVIVESTANGMGNDFEKLYNRAKTGKTEWVALFFPWHEDPNCTMTLEVPADVFQVSLDDDERLMMLQYHLTLEQLNFRRWKIANDLDGDPRMFQQEYPINDKEAFLVTGRPYFMVDTIQRQQPEAGAVGELRIEQVGMREELVFRPNPRGALTVWKRPDPAKHYVIGVDPAGGKDINLGVGNPDPDFSVASVGERDLREQVAQLRERIQPSALADYVYELGRWYNWAYVVAEVNAKIGVAFIDRLLALNYPPARIYKRKYLDRAGQPVSEKFGWYADEGTRNQLLGYYSQALLAGRVIIKSDVSIQELFSFVIHPDGKPAAAIGSHDDCVFGDGYMIVGFNQAPVFEHQGARKVEVIRGQTMRQQVVRQYMGAGQMDDEEGWND